MEQGEALHSLQLRQREKLTMTGVSEVISFEENMVALQTDLGTLLVQGQQLQLKKLALENGEVWVEGNICALIYEESRQKGSWRQRLFG